MNPYGCHNRTIGAGYYLKQRVYSPDGTYIYTDKFIPHVMSMDCRYDHQKDDERCQGCRHIS